MTVFASGMRGRAVQRAGRGFSLVELLVATVVVSAVLSAAYGWVWNLASLARTTDDRSQASTVAAALARVVADDVRSAVAVCAPPAGRDPGRSIALTHDGVDAAPEDVLIVWDVARGVVWRNASGTYIADHVKSFAVRYTLAGGRDVGGASVDAPDWEGIRAVTVAVTVRVGDATVARTVCVGVGTA